MKPIFCMDTTVDKKNTEIHGKEFISRTASEEKTRSFTQKRDAFVKAVNDTHPPMWLQVVKWFLGLFGAMVVIPAIFAGFEKVMERSPALLISGSVAAILWVVLTFVARAWTKRVIARCDLEALSREVYRAFEEVQRELEIPTATEKVDVLTFKYRLKDGRVIPKTYGIQATPYLNVDVKMYASADVLYITDVENVYSIKKSEIRGITDAKARVVLPMWNKEESPKSERYKEYRLGPNTLGGVTAGGYHVVEIEHEGELFGLYIPSYELDTVRRLLG